MSAGTGGFTEAREATAVALLDRAVLQAKGPDRAKFLQAMLSNEVLALPPGQGRPAALLDVKGHAQAFVRVLVLKDAVHLEVNRDRLAPVQQTLEHYKVAAPVRFEARSLAVLAVLGPGAGAMLRGLGAEEPPDAPDAHHETRISGHSARVVRASDLPGPGFVLQVEEGDAEAVRDALLRAGAAALEPTALDALRVEAGRPWYGRDVTAQNILHETGLVAELCSLQKGCYLGQEVVARLDARGGHVNKRLRGLRLEAPTRDGAAITVDGRDVGRVTTAAVSPRLGAIALGYVHRDHAAPGARVLVDGAPALVSDLPLESALPRTA